MNLNMPQEAPESLQTRDSVKSIAQGQTDVRPATSLLLASVVYNNPVLVRRSLEAIRDTVEDWDSLYWGIRLNDPPYEFDYQKLMSEATALRSVISSYGNRNIGNAAGYEGMWAALTDWSKNVMEQDHPSLYIKADDDTAILTPGWDKTMRRAFELDPKIGVLSADIDIDKMQGPSRVTEIGEGLRIEEFENPCVGGGFTAYSAKMRAEIGGLNTSLGLYAGEDVEMCNRARAAGYKTAYLLNVRCVHLCRTSDGKYSDDADEAYGEWKRLYHARVLAKMNGCAEDQLPGTDKDFETWMEAMK